MLLFSCYFVRVCVYLSTKGRYTMNPQKKQLPEEVTMSHKELAEFIITGKVKEYKEPVCEICLEILTEEEEANFGDLCFSCAEKMGNGFEGTPNHPDDKDGWQDWMNNDERYA